MTGPEERSQSPESARPAAAPAPHERSFGPAAPAQEPPAEAPAHREPHREPHLAPAHPHHEPAHPHPTTAPHPQAAAQQPPAHQSPAHQPPVHQPPPHQPAQQPAAPSQPPAAAAGVPPRPAPLPPPRSTTATTTLPPRGPARPAGGATPAARPVTRGRRARLTLRRIDPWSVFLWSVVASIFLGLALLVAVAVLYGLLSSMGVVESLNELIGDVTAEPGETSVPSELLSGGKILSVTAVVAAVDVVLLTALATLGAFLYNLCAALTGGIEVTFGDRE